MKKHKFFTPTVILMPLLFIISVCWTETVEGSIEVPRISIEAAKKIINNPDVIFIDLRTAKSWWRSSTKIPNAVREEPGAVKQWAAKYTKDKTLILYCA